MKMIRFPNKEEIVAICARPQADQVGTNVQEIMKSVESEGDSSVRFLTKQFDGCELQGFLVSEKELNEISAEVLGETFSSALRTAIKNISTFHLAQRSADIEVTTTPGVRCMRKTVPIERVGLYVPGGTAPLFSTLLMLAIPAQIAGVKEIVVCTPPRRDGTLAPELLFAAKELGLRSIFKVGGAQAIAAMTYGTETIPSVDKIFGPGNQFVTAAKLVAQMEGVAIDLPAGPSELAIVADSGADPKSLAWDLLAQAEHGCDSQVLLVSWDETLLVQTIDEVQRSLGELPRREFAERSLLHSSAVLVRDVDAGLSLVNQYAPEHLILALKDAREHIEFISNAGSVFLGYFTPESLGDYASGTNHVLPTSGAARGWSGVSLESFQKKITFQEASPQGLTNLGPSVITLAEAEGLYAHGKSVSIRLDTERETYV